MKVRSVLHFIEQFTPKEEAFTPCDSKLLRELREYFSTKLSDDELSDADVNFIIDLYSSRWDYIKDTVYDYTWMTSDASQKWRDFSKLLATGRSGSYLNILFPEITNKIDPNNGSDLTETETLTNFYLDRYNSLCRKRGFFDHLRNHAYKLSMFRSDSRTDLSIVTLDELSRLKRCHQSNGQFSISHSSEQEQFINFWDFLRKKSFTTLTSSGEVPRSLLPSLLDLIESYYILKTKKHDFSEFKRGSTRFFNCLYMNELSDVNCLYGQKVTYKESSNYLLDVFLAIFEADKFDLEHEMTVLAQFLFQFNPILKVRNKECASFYHTLSQSRVMTKENEQTEAYERCCSIFVSLHANKFTTTFFAKTSIIEAWDIDNRIPFELYKIYIDLRPIFEVSNPDYIGLYRRTLDGIIIPKTMDNSFLTWCMRDETTMVWLKHVSNLHLAEVGGYWFEPECILSVLSNFHADKSEFQVSISFFLDDLISTYAQSRNNSEKKLRVNILFSQFLSLLSEQQRRGLIIHIVLCDKASAQKKFIDNCSLHLDKRLKSLGYIPPIEASPCFFPAQAKSPASIASQKVLDLIDAYTKLPGVKSDDRIGKFLFQLKDPILTASEKEVARASVQLGSDSIGAPT